MRLMNLLRKALPSNIAEAGINQTALLSPQGAIPSFSADRAVELYTSWVYVAMNKNATAVANQPIRLYATRAQGESLPKIAPYKILTKEQQGKIREEAKLQQNSKVCTAEEIVEICDHPFLDLMRNPNPFRAGFEFMEQTKLWLDGTGNNYWHIVKGTGLMKDIPVQLWTLPSNQVNIVPDTKKFIKGYLYGQTGRKTAIRPNDVIHHRMPALRDRYYGKGRIEGMWQAVRGYQSIEKYESGQAENPIPALVIKYKTGSLQKKQRRELMAEWNRLLNQQASDRSNIAAVADGTFDVEKLSFSPREMAMLKGREFRREEIINGHGQSMALYSDRANRSNAEAAIYMWGRYELDPSLTRIAQKINQTLLPMYEGGPRLFCAFDRVADDDQNFLIKRESADVKYNLRTRNEIRQSRNLPTSDDPRADDLFYSETSSAGDDTDIDNTDKTISTDHLTASPALVDGSKYHPDLRGVPICEYP